jgi:solute carrier family 35 (adenosine 3'-phospho 5'-phosphosulfate transporter), member B2
MSQHDSRDSAAYALEEGKPSHSRREVEKYSKKDDDFWRNMKLLYCFLGLQVSYILWGLVQEYLMTRDYKTGKFKSSAFCVFGNRFLALLISLGIVLFRRWSSTKPLPEAPFYYYAPSSLSNTLSSWAQYEALKYISFPTQVLSKSCKIIPVMLVRLSVNNDQFLMPK